MTSPTRRNGAWQDAREPLGPRAPPVQVVHVAQEGRAGTASHALLPDAVMREGEFVP